MITMGSNLLGVQNCPHCGISKPNLSYVTFAPYPYVNSDSRKCWIIYQCSSCSNVVGALGTYTVQRLQSSPPATLNNNPQEPQKIIPQNRTVNSDLPVRAKAYLEQAINSINAPDGAVMLAGSAVDSMLKESGYKDGSVYDRIGLAVDDHVLTPAMGEWAHSVRMESNKPRHSDDDDPHATTEIAEQTIRFAEALGEYLFALPARIKRGKIAADEAKTQQTIRPRDEVL